MIPQVLLRALLPATIVAAVVGSATASSPSTAAAYSGRAPQATSWSASRLDSVGVYTAAQAERGKAVYTSVCAECHELEDFTHPDFRADWNGVSLFEFFENIRTTMPDENPGTLLREQYVDVVTYVLQLNELPEGPAEFTGDSASASSVLLDLPPRGH